ncbi:oligosaccharide flippase family protein [candidate division KSB1 bacterium]|nr:oligosaccharide flippase family protein [candidate division KSB1 bacterium]
MSFLKRISNAFFWNHLNRITGYLLDFVLSIVLARGLGDYGFGLYSELINFVFLFSLICSLGIDQAINVYIPRYTKQPGVVSHLLRKTFLILAIESISVIFLIYFSSGALSQFINSPELASIIKIAAFYIVFHNFFLIGETILISYYATKTLFLLNNSLKALFIVSTWFFLNQGLGLKEIILGYIAVSTVVSIFYLIKFYRYIKPTPEKSDFSKFFRFGLVTWLTKFLNYVLGRYFDILLMGYFLVPKNEIGYYNIAFSAVLALFYFFTSGFGGIMMAAFAEFEQKGEKSKMAEGWQKVTEVCIFFSIPVFSYVLFNAKHIIPIIYSETYSSSVPLLCTFGVFYLITIIIGGGTNTAILYTLHKEKTVLVLRMIMGLLNVVLDIILIPQYRAMGAIIATGIATVGIYSLEFSYVLRFLSIKFPFRFLFKIITASLLSVLVSWILPISQITGLIVNLIVSVLTFFITLYFLKPFSAADKAQIMTINRFLGRLLHYF